MAMKLRQLLVVCVLITWRLLRAAGVEPKRSLRLPKKKVTMGRQGTVEHPEVLPYGYAGTRKSGLGNMPEGEDISGEVSERDSINTKEHGDPSENSGNAAGEDPLEEQ